MVHQTICLNHLMVGIKKSYRQLIYPPTQPTHKVRTNQLNILICIDSRLNFTLVKS